MDQWREDIEGSIEAFIKVAELAGDTISPLEIQVEYLGAPHHPPKRLPAGTMAIYGFWHEGTWLKIGKAGQRSNARYTSQHYNPNVALSTLAASLKHDPEMCSVIGIDSGTVGDWIKSHTNRINILLPSTRHPELLSLLEAFLHMRLRPRYEG